MGFKPDKLIRLIIGLDEEVEWKSIDKYFKTKKKETRRQTRGMASSKKKHNRTLPGSRPPGRTHARGPSRRPRIVVSRRPGIAVSGTCEDGVMAYREIRIIGDPILRTECDWITDIDNSVRALVENLCLST